jgi:hypothetical protein
MRIGLIDVDGHNFPNLAMMKLSAYHKSQGDVVEFGKGIQRKKRVDGIWTPVFSGVSGEYDPASLYDVVYVSKVFSYIYSADIDFTPRAGTVVYGGTGYDLKTKLPGEIEHMCPDYSLYNSEGISYGFCTRGCPRACPFCCVAEKEGRKSIAVADPSEWYRGGAIKLLDPNLLACKDHIKILKLLADTNAPIDFTQGLDARLLNDENIHILNGINVKTLHFAWDLMKESGCILRGLKAYARHGKIKDRRRRIVYVLTNYNTTHEEDLYRVYKLRELGFDPDVRIFDKPHAPQRTRDLQRWVNNRRISGKCKRFEDYDPKAS